MGLFLQFLLVNTLLMIFLLRETTSQYDADGIAGIYKAVLDSFDANLSYEKNIDTILNDLCPQLSTNCDLNNEDNISSSHFLLNQSLIEINPAREFLITNAHLFQSCCGKCSCESICFVNGNCCKSKRNQVEPRSYLQQIRSSCVYGNIKVYKTGTRYTHNLDQVSYFMVTKCFYENADVDDVNRCHRPNIKNPVEVTPVTSINTNITYWNRYCAKCNLDEGVKRQWKPHISFKSITGFQGGRVLPKSLSELLQLSTRSSTDIQFTPPASLNMTYEDQVCIQNDLIFSTQSSNRNITSLGCETMHHLCLKANSTLFFPPEGKRVYRNVFCFLCMNRERVIQTANFQCTKVSARLQANGIYGLLNFENVQEEFNDRHLAKTAAQNTNNCTCREIFDRKQGKCRKVYCPFMEGYIRCSCVRLIGDVNGVQVKAFLELRPISHEGLKQKRTDERFVEGILSAVTKRLRKAGKITVGTYAVFLCSDIAGDFLYFASVIKPKFGHDSLIILTEVLRNLNSNMSLTFEGMSFKMSIGPLFKWRKDTDKLSLSENEDLITSERLYLSFENKRMFYFYESLSPLLFCKQVIVTPDEIAENIGNSTDVSNIGMLKQGNLYMFISEDGVQICQEDFMRMFQTSLNIGVQLLVVWKVHIMALVLFCTLQILLF